MVQVCRCSIRAPWLRYFFSCATACEGATNQMERGRHTYDCFAHGGCKGAGSQTGHPFSPFQESDSPNANYPIAHLHTVTLPRFHIPPCRIYEKDSRKESDAIDPFATVESVREMP